MLSPVRHTAGLGDPPSEYFTNDSEAINSAIKQFLGFKKSDWPTFNDQMKQFVRDQQEEVCKALIGLGQYTLRKQYQYLAVKSNVWFTSLSSEQKERAVKKFRNAPCMPHDDQAQQPANYAIDDQSLVDNEQLVNDRQQFVGDHDQQLADEYIDDQQCTDDYVDNQQQFVDDHDQQLTDDYIDDEQFTDDYGNDQQFVEHHQVANDQQFVDDLQSHGGEHLTCGQTRQLCASKDPCVSEQSASITKVQSAHVDQIANCNSQPCQTKGLSVDILYASSRTGIPTLVLKSMWSKAVDLLVSNDCAWVSILFSHGG